MLTEPLYQALQALGLRGMAGQFSAQLQNTDLATLPFNDRMALLIDAEQSARSNCRYAQRLRWAKLGQSASLEDLDQRTPRGLDKSLVVQLTTLAFVEDKRNLLITGVRSDRRFANVEADRQIQALKDYFKLQHLAIDEPR